MKAVLIPNIEGFPSVSMVRHARELEAGLRRTGAGEWEFETLFCDGKAPWMEALPGALRGRAASLWGRWVAYPQVVSRARGDIYHIFDHSHATLASAAPAGRAVVTCHDIIPLLAARGLVPIPVKPWIRRTFLKRLDAMRRCAVVMTVSESTRADLIRHAGFVPEQVVVVHNGIEARFRPDPPAPSTRAQERAELYTALGVPAGARVVLHVGTRNRYKNTPALLRALQLLRQGPEPVILVRVGAPLYDDEAALAQSLGVESAVIQAVGVSDDALVAHYRAADVFAFPSLYEGFGWPPLEAMACGTPVVTANTASLPEVVGDAGETVAPDDFAALAGAISRLLGDEGLRQNRIERGLERARHFSWERCARETLAVYGRIRQGVQ